MVNKKTTTATVTEITPVNDNNSVMDQQFQAIADTLKAMQEKHDRDLQELNEQFNARMAAVLGAVQAIKEVNRPREVTPPILERPKEPEVTILDGGTILQPLRTLENGESSQLQRGFGLPVPKIEIQFFKGENPRGWIRKWRKYFLLYKVPESQMVDVASMYLDGVAESWYAGVIAGGRVLSWDEFCDLLCVQFCGKGYTDIVDEFEESSNMKDPILVVNSVCFDCKLSLERNCSNEIENNGYKSLIGSYNFDLEMNEPKMGVFDLEVVELCHTTLLGLCEKKNPDFGGKGAKITNTEIDFQPLPGVSDEKCLHDHELESVICCGKFLYSPPVVVIGEDIEPTDGPPWVIIDDFLQERQSMLILESHGAVNFSVCVRKAGLLNFMSMSQEVECRKCMTVDKRNEDFEGSLLLHHIVCLSVCLFSLQLLMYIAKIDPTDGPPWIKCIEVLIHDIEWKHFARMINQNHVLVPLNFKVEFVELERNGLDKDNGLAAFYKLVLRETNKNKALQILFYMCSSIWSHFFLQDCLLDLLFPWGPGIKIHDDMMKLQLERPSIGNLLKESIHGTTSENIVMIEDDQGYHQLQDFKKWHGTFSFLEIIVPVAQILVIWAICQKRCYVGRLGQFAKGGATWEDYQFLLSQFSDSKAILEDKN